MSTTTPYCLFFSLNLLLIMPKTIKSSTRNLLFTMINKFNDVKSDINEKSAKKIQQLNSIASLLESIDDEYNREIKLNITKVLHEMISVEKNEILTCEKHYLEKISSMTEVSVKTLRRKHSNIHNHEILLLPPYHCDLNAIELVWSQAKRKVASKNIGIPASEMQNLIKVCFDSVTNDDWKKYTDHVINVENQYKARDQIFETELERFIINVGGDSSEESSEPESLSGVEYLESDFDFDS